MVKAEIAIQQQKQKKYVCEGTGRQQSPAKTKNSGYFTSRMK